MRKIRLRVVANADDAFLIWRADKIDGCLGFAIERQWRAGGHPARPAGRSTYLLNRVGFRSQADVGRQPRQPSTVWPFQRYDWTDHDIRPGDKVRYRIVPVGGSAAHPRLMKEQASDWVDADASAPDDGALHFYFNRPMAASRWMAQVAFERGIGSSAELISHMGDINEEHLRAFCGGTLIAGLRALFDVADRDPSLRLHAVLFELEDEEVVARFCRLGPRARIVLANGAAKETEPDRNHAARSRLREAGCEVFDRMTAAPGGGGKLAHNKFIVVERDGKASATWTGSTNLTTTGLFTQINNAVLIEDAALADQYLAQWQRLADAGNDPPATLRATNGAPGTATHTPADIEPWFTPAVKKGDLERLRDLVEQAKDGILFLSFMPGPDGPVLDILKERSSGGYVRGVLNQFVGGADGALMAVLLNDRATDPMHLDVVTPGGVRQQLEFWAEEFTKGGSLSVLVHSKVICIDPFGERPVVVTGSHNFSAAASSSNDENFLVIEGSHTLAQAYAAHIISVYNHYRWRAYLTRAAEAGHKPWQKLEDSPAWQDGRLASNKQQQEWAFWM